MAEKTRLEVLVTTMHQTDMKKYQEMNLQTDAVIANQTDKNAYCEESINGHMVKMISTDTRGLSRNRNIALTHASGDLIMFTDDDAVFLDGYEKIIIQQFQQHPEADGILFDVKIESIPENRKAKNIENPKKYQPANRRILASRAVYGLVIRKEILRRHTLYFNEEFGTGTENYSGEDTIFLQDLVKSKAKIFLSPTVIATMDKSGSTWFEGFNNKYFYVAGKVLAAIYPKVAYILAVRSAYRFSKRETDMGFLDILGCYFSGIKDYLRR